MMSVQLHKTRFSQLPSDTTMCMTLADLRQFARELLYAKPTEDDAVLSERQVLAQYPISRTRLFTLRASRKVRYMKNGTRIFYRESDIKQLFIEQ